MTRLSPNFTLEEGIKPQMALRRGIANTPSPDALAHMKHTTNAILEPVRAHEVADGGVPRAVNSKKDGRAMQTLQSLDPTVPVLWAALRETRTEIANLNQRIRTLELK